MSDQPQAGQEQQKSRSNVYTVFDLNQRGEKPRSHDIIVKMYKDGQEPDIISYPLWSDMNKGCPMPMEHALKFLCDPAFKVMSPNGNRIRPIEKMDLSKPLKTLAVDEVVVKYEFLSRDYLFKLVKLQPGSEDVKLNATAEELATFMVKWRQSLVGMTDGERALAEMMGQGELGGSMDKDQLDKMFGEQQRKAA